jgi:hypothetical protein
MKSNQLELSNGNRKIGKDTLIFNMSSAQECPSLSLGLCKVLNKKGLCGCYAANQERIYKEVLPYRTRQKAYWQACSASRFIEDLDSMLSRRNTLRNRVRFFRFNEAGDFHNQEEVDKAEAIAIEMKARGIQAYTYTARSDLDFSKCSALLVKGSGHDQGNNGKAIVRKAGPEVEQARAEGFKLCPGACKKCHACKRPNGLNIVFQLH